MEFIKDQEKRILLSAISREKKVIKEHKELAELIPVINRLDYYFMYDRLFKKIYQQGRADVLEEVIKLHEEFQPKLATNVYEFGERLRQMQKGEENESNRC